ncbi:MAG: hypothetical protein GY953_39300 [bacterium]|nr:hypothetical protein [bacterium]
MAVATTTLIVAGIAMAATMASAAAAAEAQKQQAENLEVAAGASRETAAFRAKEYKRKASRVAAKDRANRAASDIDISTGSAAAVAAEQAAEAEFQSDIIQHGGAVESWRFTSQADQQRQAATNTMIQGAVTGITSGLAAGLNTGAFKQNAPPMKVPPAPSAVASTTASSGISFGGPI